MKNYTIQTPNILIAKQFLSKRYKWNVKVTGIEGRYFKLTGNSRYQLEGSQNPYSSKRAKINPFFSFSCHVMNWSCFRAEDGDVSMENTGQKRCANVAEILQQSVELGDYNFAETSERLKLPNIGYSFVMKNS